MSKVVTLIDLIILKVVWWEGGHRTCSVGDEDTLFKIEFEEEGQDMQAWGSATPLTLHAAQPVD